MKAINPPYLVNVGSQTMLVAHIEQGRVFFIQPFLKTIMEKFGVAIPPSERKNFEGRSVVYLSEDGDPLFEKAFRSIYYALHMPKDEYQWVFQKP